MKTFVVYHANCIDGFGAAFSAWKALGDSVEYIPLNHYDPIPKFPRGSTIYCIDFCFKRHEILSLIDHSKVIILDHHLSELEAVKDLIHNFSHPNLEIKFDLDKSGAILAWEYWHKEAAPDYFAFIEDRDLGRYALKETMDLTAVLMLYPKDFATWNDLSKQRLLTEGPIFKRLQDQIMRETLERHHMAFISGQWVPVVNSTCFWSDITFELLKMYPQAPFVAAYYAVDGERQKWSLRSPKGSNVDVSKISKEYGGGGHKHSGGFTSLNHEISFKEEKKKAA